MGWWVADLWRSDPAMLLAWVFWVVFSITLHELGHGWAAISRGDRTPIETGHMTWNPMVHMGPMSLLLLALIGIAWGMMPVNPHRMRGRHADAFVAAAGPLMNLALAVVCVVFGAAWSAWGLASGAGPEAHRVVFVLFYTGAFLNLILLLFNLLPVPPLDGSRILASFSPAYERLISHPNAQLFTLFAFVFVFFTAGDVIFPLASDAVHAAIGGIVRVLP